MAGKLSDELINISTMLMVAQERGDILRATNALNEAILAIIETEERTGGLATEKKKALSAIIKFSKGEVMKMSKTFKKEFIANGCVAHIIKRPSGKSGWYYQIRYRRNGYDISVADKNLDTVKQKFIEKTLHLEDLREVVKTKVTLASALSDWLAWKKGKVDIRTWKNAASNAKRYLPEDLTSKPIKDIKVTDVDRFMRSLEERPRIYEEVRSILNQTFKFAIANGVVERNPVQLTKFKQAERQPREALNVDQIKAFLIRVQQPQFDPIRQFALAMYFFGLRPCEIDKELRVEGNFIIARNRKRKRGKIEFKKIPIHPLARKYIDFNKSLCCGFASKAQCKYLKLVLGGTHTAYSLRHTFSTLCQKSVRPDIVDIWMGDSPERLVGRFYTHFDDDFMYKQMEKVEFITSD